MKHEIQTRGASQLHRLPLIARYMLWHGECRANARHALTHHMLEAARVEGERARHWLSLAVMAHEGRLL